MDYQKLLQLDTDFRHTLDSLDVGSGYKAGFDAGYALGKCHAIEQVIKLCASDFIESLPTDKQHSGNAQL